jgi:hypothetical protein
MSATSYVQGQAGRIEVRLTQPTQARCTASRCCVSSSSFVWWYDG